MNRYSSEIIKELSHITSSGTKPFQIFEDYLDLTLATLEAMPAHVRSAVKEHKPAEDTKETSYLRSCANAMTQFISRDFQTLL
jgi:hypothetical protein